MNVTSTAHTPNPSRLVAAAARLCHSPLKPEEVYNGLTGEKAAKLISDIRASGHMSPFERAVFAFGVSGPSRTASRRLARRRMASYSQQSQRYASMEDNPVVLPPLDGISAGRTEEILAEIEAANAEARAHYGRLMRLGLDKEDARLASPHGGATNIVFTMNARELPRFFRLRLRRRAQWEIREPASDMRELASSAAPESFQKAGSPCYSEGRRPEPPSRSCGRPYNPGENIS